MTELNQRDPRTYAIIGAAMEVHRQLGCGFLEAVYHDALVIEFSERGIPHRREVDVPVFYKGRRLECDYRADFVCFDAVIVELKALGELTGVHEAQVLNYLKATGFEVGLLINFGAASLQYKRLAFSKSQSAKSAQSADRSLHPQIAQMEEAWGAAGIAGASSRAFSGGSQRTSRV